MCIRDRDKDETELKSYLESIGDSLVAVSDDEIVKVHVHTNQDVYKRQICLFR